jgi:hypothetical protein
MRKPVGASGRGFTWRDRKTHEKPVRITDIRGEI